MHRDILIAIVCLGAAAAGAAGEAPPPVLHTRAEIDQRLTELTNQQLELTYTLQDQLKKIDALWQDAHLSSPEIDALRQKRAALVHELAAIEAALRKQVAARPEFQAEQQRLDDVRATFQALGREIENLKRRRLALP